MSDSFTVVMIAVVALVMLVGLWPGSEDRR